MAGFREFVTGEVLTAGNVNDYLMQQSVMKFADAAARDTALGTAVGGSNALREGMVAYLDSTDEVLFYDGAAWGAVGLPLGTATPTDGQVLAFGTATSTWNPTDGGALVQMVYATDGTDRSTSSTSFTDASISVSITPSSASNALVISWNFYESQATSSGSVWTHFRVVDASDTPVTGLEDFENMNQVTSSTRGSRFTTQATGVIIAGSTSTLTFRGQFRAESGTKTIGNAQKTGVLTVMEVRQ